MSSVVVDQLHTPGDSPVSGRRRELGDSTSGTKPTDMGPAGDACNPVIGELEKDDQCVKKPVGDGQSSPVKPDIDFAQEPEETATNGSDVETVTAGGDAVSQPLLTPAMLKEEEKLEAKADQEEGKERGKREQLWKQLDEEVKAEKYARLQFLLSKSNMYTQYLMERMARQRDEMKKRIERHKKRQEKITEKKRELKQQENLPKPDKQTKSQIAENSQATSKPVDSSPVVPQRSLRSSSSQEMASSQESQGSTRSSRKRQRKDAPGAALNSPSAKKRKPAVSRDSKTVDEDCKEISKEANVAADVTNSNKENVNLNEDQRVKEQANQAAGEVDAEVEGGAEMEADGTIVKPYLFTGGSLRRYQVEGLNWLKVLYENGVNGILADEMGLGKTIQCIALIAHLAALNVVGPYLVVAPLSTLPNWHSEFRRFAPRLPVLFYHGTKTVRADLRRKIMKLHPIRGAIKVHPVVITSYEMTMIDRKFLQNYNWRYLIVDEGHRIKNTHCRLIKELRLYQNTHRLLLTGTPLQNNLAELWSLLNFLLPEIFDDLSSFETWLDVEHISAAGADEEIVREEQKKNILSMLHQILTPFMLRRVKADVDLRIPPKKEIVVYAALTEAQGEFYTSTVDRSILQKIEDRRKRVPEEVEVSTTGRPKRKSLKKVNYSLMIESESDAKEAKNKKKEEEALEEWIEAIIENNKPEEKAGKERLSQVTVRLQNIMMQLRKCCNHPYLLEYPLDQSTGEYLVDSDIIQKSGKMILLDRMLIELKKHGHKVLIFSQMTKMLDILEDYCCFKKYEYCRLDGSCSLDNRRDQIASFNEEEEAFIFLLSTRAGGLGINLTSADTVIIYDSDWNPQCDLQAQDRCHRIGQTRPVMVYRFVTANTIDQRIVERAAAKRKLEKMVIHKGKFKTGMRNFDTLLQPMKPEELLELLQSKDHNAEVRGKDGNCIDAGELEALLDRSDMIQQFADVSNTDKKGKRGSSKAATKPSPEACCGLFKVLDFDKGRTTLQSTDSETVIKEATASA